MEKSGGFGTRAGMEAGDGEVLSRQPASLTMPGQDDAKVAKAGEVVG